MGIFAQGIGYAYGRKTVLSDIGFTVAKGSRFAILGPNGAGKSTLISILATLLRPQTGQATLEGIDIRKSFAARQKLGVVFQGHSLDDRLTVWENLELHGLVYGMPRKARVEAIDHILALMDLEARREAGVRSLSGGMRRRLEIGRALMHRPSIIFLDEPTAGLDPQSRGAISRHLRELSSQGVTVLTTTHYIEEVADYDQVCILDQGRILADGTPEGLVAQHGRTRIEGRFSPQADIAAITARYPAIEARGESFSVPMPADQVEGFVKDFGPVLSGFHRFDPDLESVFLSLTGRGLRDEAGAIREKGHRAW